MPEEGSQEVKADAGLLDPTIAAHYLEGLEIHRLHRGAGRLERIRTEELLGRYIPAPPAVVLDVGGGPGHYACWLAQQGYTVHLLDPLPLHVEQALAASELQHLHPLASAALGDSRNLPQPSESCDAVLLLGPLYHLVERAERIRTFAEALRVLRPGGVVIAGAISRYASLHEAILNGHMVEERFIPIVSQDILDGQHRDPAVEYFTTSFFHHPDELDSEMLDAGLTPVATLAVEGIAWTAAQLSDWLDEPSLRDTMLGWIRALEAERTLLGASGHMIAIGQKPEPDSVII